MVSFGGEHTNIKLMKGPMQIVNCFVEEWEEEAKLKQDAVSEAKTLKKYSGLE